MGTPRKTIGQPVRLHMKPLALYEDMLLNCLAFFRTNRRPTVQAHHCLSMYLRQSEGRIKSEVSFYANLLDLSTDELMQLIYTDPDKAKNLIDEIGVISPVGDDDPDDIE